MLSEQEKTIVKSEIGKFFKYAGMEMTPADEEAYFKLIDSIKESIEGTHEVTFSLMSP